MSFSQQKNRPASLNPVGYNSNEINQSAPDKLIFWQKVVTQDLLGLGKYSLLNFNNAQFDFSNHFFPVYSEKRLKAGSELKMHNEWNGESPKNPQPLKGCLVGK